MRAFSFGDVGCGPSRFRSRMLDAGHTEGVLSPTMNASTTYTAVRLSASLLGNYAFSIPYRR